MQEGDGEPVVASRITFQDFAELLDPPQPLFVVGSALSKAPPASAPGAPDVLKATMQALAGFADFHEESDDADLRALFDPPLEVLPESLYAAVAEAFPPGVHEAIWGALAAEPRAAVPNLGHLAIALCTIKSGGAILTTNFDTFLEEAVSQVGGRHEVLTGKELWEGKRPRLAPGRVLILKIHGTAENPESIVSKTPDLTRTARVLRRSGLAGRFETAVVIGYRGKDFDVFPWIAAASGIKSTVWVDLPGKFDVGFHRSEDAPCCLAVEEDAEVLAAQLLQRWADRGDDTAQRVLREHQARLALPSDEPSLKDRVIETAVAAIGALPSERRTAARWVLARVFADIGRHVVAERVAAVELSGAAADRVELLLLRSFVAASMDRYSDAADLAREAAAGAKDVEDRKARRAFRSRARLQVAYANVLYHKLTIDLPEVDPGEAGSRSGSRDGVRPAAAFLGVLAREAPLGIPAVWTAWRASFGESPKSFRLSCDYLESLIRASAFLSPVLPGPVTHLAFLALDRVCHEAGYVVGTLNCARYLRRFPRLDKDVRLRGRMAVLNDLIALSLDERDAVARMPTDQDGEASPLSSAALRHARESGAPSISLKIEVVRKARGLRPLLSRADVASLLDEVQAAPVKARREEILDWLTGG